jgi:hypothetical protein
MRVVGRHGRPRCVASRELELVRDTERRGLGRTREVSRWQAQEQRHLMEGARAILKAVPRLFVSSWSNAANGSGQPGVRTTLARGRGPQHGRRARTCSVWALAASSASRSRSNNPGAMTGAGSAGHSLGAAAACDACRDAETAPFRGILARRRPLPCAAMTRLDAAQ